MPIKIGIRIYQLTVRRLQFRKPLPFKTEGIKVALPDFVKWFVTANISTREATLEENQSDRRWHFKPRSDNMPYSNKGVIRYGISGFESDLIDSKTNNHEFRRKITHIEVIPLFYEFWFPDNCNYALAVFQSFAARSCIELVSAKMRDDFKKQNPGFSLHFRKLLPTGAGGVYDAASVKNLRLIKRNASSDVADRYLNANVGQAVDFQVVISARRKRFLGTLGDLTNSMKAAKGGVVQHDGVIFEEATAEIDFGGRKRRVGIFGSNSEAGVIDLTDIQRAPDGHPLFSSISKEATALLADFQSVLGKTEQS